MAPLVAMSPEPRGIAPPDAAPHLHAFGFPASQAESWKAAKLAAVRLKYPKTMVQAINNKKKYLRKKKTG